MEGKDREIDKEEIFFSDNNQKSNSSQNIKYCTHCGKPIDKDAVICINCGCSVEENNKKLEMPIVSMATNYDESKRTIGIISGFFLGIFALIIGVLVYPVGTIARDTFIKGCVIGLLIPLCISAVIFSIMMIVGLSAGALMI